MRGRIDGGIDTYSLTSSFSSILVVSCSLFAVIICVSYASVIALVRCYYCSFSVCYVLLPIALYFVVVMLSFLYSLFQTVLRCFLLMFLQDPYVASADPSGSSTGSATSIAANMAAVALGMETAGSILSPSSANSVVGIKPTVGLTSRAGVIPISHRQDTVGPICRTVTDAVEVFDVIVGFDRDDFAATKKASTYIPHGGYRQFLKADGLRDKRLGISKDLFGSSDIKTYQQHFNTLRQKGAVVVDNLVIPYPDLVYNAIVVAQYIALSAEFKMDLNAYLKHLVQTQVRSLADVIAFNKISALEKLKKYGQDIMLEAEKTNGIGKLEREALRNITKACKYGFEKMMKENKLDALMSPGADIAGLLAIGGYPGINVPAGYDKTGAPFGISFGGLKGSEPTLIEIAYGFEQATHIRKTPPSHPQ